MSGLIDPAFDAIDDRHAFTELGIDSLSARDSVLQDSLPRWGDQATLFPWDANDAADAG